MKSKMNQELDAILNDQDLNLSITKAVDALEQMAELAGKRSQMILDSEPVMSQYYYQSEIMKMDINPRDKVILIDMLLQGNSVKGTEAQVRCGMSKTGYNNGARSLVKQKITVKDKCGYYSINSKIF